MAEPIINTIYFKSLTWGTTSWDNSNGGTIAMDYVHEGEVIQDWTGIDEYSKVLFVVNKILECTVRIRNCKRTEALNASNNDIVGTLAGLSDVPITLKTMGLVGARVGQGRVNLGEAALRFRHKSADGTTVPIA